MGVSSLGWSLSTRSPVVSPLQTLTDSIHIPLRSTSGGLASAEGMLEGHEKPFNFIIDTGASTTVISKAAVKRFSLENLKIKNSYLRFRPSVR